MNPTANSISTFEGLEKATIVGAVTTVRVWLVEDNPSVRDVLMRLLGNHDQIHCAREFSSAEELLSELELGSAPDVILMDIHMGGMSGVEAVAPTRMLAPETRVVLMTTFFDADQAAEAARSGASDFLLKSNPIEQITDRLVRAATLPPAPNCQAGPTRAGAKPSTPPAIFPLLPWLAATAREWFVAHRTTERSGAR